VLSMERGGWPVPGQESHGGMAERPPDRADDPVARTIGNAIPAKRR
jgi:hypothetical protein